MIENNVNPAKEHEEKKKKKKKISCAKRWLLVREDVAKCAANLIAILYCCTEADLAERSESALRSPLFFFVHYPSSGENPQKWGVPFSRPISARLLIIGSAGSASYIVREVLSVRVGQRRSGQSVTASDFGSNGPRFESGRGRCVESLDKALYSHCPKEKPLH